MRANIEGFLALIAGIPERVLGALRGAGSWLVGIGKDLIQGLISGAQSVLSNLGKFFLDVVPAWIREPFKQALGIHSPSTGFAGYAINLGEGLLVGADQIQPQVTARMGSLVEVPNVRANIDGAVADARDTGAAARLPETLVIVDADGQLIGRMRVEADRRILRADEVSEMVLRGGTLR